ncbi:MAG: hypothetical protein NTY19_29940 [Planctomycetota bacterium]|nr:hypothetical protein [Planctomycetota bacterium]
MGALAQQERRTLLQYAALLMTGAAAVYLSWADLEPSWEAATWLLRVVRLLIVLSAMTFLVSVVVRRQLGADSRWLEPVRRITATFGAGALVTLVLVLLIEFSIFDAERGVPIDSAHSGAVIVVLVGLVVGLLSMALWPGRDPLALSENGRMLYVYGAELVATLLFVHVYFCLPWLFHGRFHDYWPYIIMVIAFAGVGVSELFQRRGLRVLAEPLTRTGGFLPLLSALGWWVVEAKETDYSALLFLVGLLYLVLCYYRRSVLSGVAAALAGNGALWRLLYETNFAFWRHPQLWLIPPAVSVLIASQMNRRRLPPTQLAGMRYASILVIYLSSTSEMFIRGIGESLWPPMLLASLSVAGVFLGLVLQVRAFLYLGTSFVFLSMVSMVWHAQRAIQHSWPWWAFGIGLGIGILAVFGVFEKKRPEVMAWIEKLRHWEQ